jgi:hypothetical protein
VFLLRFEPVIVAVYDLPIRTVLVSKVKAVTVGSRADEIANNPPTPPA